MSGGLFLQVSWLVLGDSWGLMGCPLPMWVWEKRRGWGRLFCP